MGEIDLVYSNRFEEQDSSFHQVKDFHVGQTKLQVRLASDMDEKFLERLGSLLRNKPSLRLGQTVTSQN
jgi:hypothetical protein